MKKFFVLIFLLFISFFSIAQEVETQNNYCDRKKKFILYPIQNMWTFLKLDTRDGRIWIIQWSFENDKRFETVLSDIPLVTRDEDKIHGRFLLYPTKNIYNFILLDSVTGCSYQVQWSSDLYNRHVIPIS